MGLFDRKPRNTESMISENTDVPKSAKPIKIDRDSFNIVKAEINPNSPTSLQQLRDRKAPKKKECWQDEAWKYYEKICEISKVMNITAQTTAAASLTLEHLNEDPTCGWEQTGDERVHRVLNALYGRQGSQSELLRSAALHLQVTGDSYLLGVPALNADGTVRPNEYLWEFVSSDEIVQNAVGKLSRKSECGGKPVPLHPDTYTARLYRPHPRFSDESDSNLRHCLVVAEELLFLTRLQKAMISSRLHAGILYVPSEMLQGAYDETGEGDLKSDSVDPQLINILEYMINSVDDPESVDAVAPLIVTGPAEYEPRFQLKPFERQLDQQYIGIRKELIKRLGSGLDIPPEILDGKHGLNQSTGWQVSGEFLSLHVIPLGQKIAEFLTANFLRPMLIECEGMTKEEACKYRITFDVTEIAVRQDQATVALRLYREGVISAKSLRDQSGLCEDDAPSTEDFKNESEKLAFYVDLVKTSPVALGKIILPLIADLIGDPELKEQADKLFLLNKDGTINEDILREGVDPSDQDVDRVRPGGENRENEGNPSATPSNDAQPDRPGTRARGEEANSILVERLTTACDSAFERTHERAGAKFLSVAAPKVKGRLELTPKVEMFSVLQESDVDETGKDVAFFFEGSYDRLNDKFKPWVESWLMETHKVNEYVAIEESAEIVRQLVSELETFTIQRTFDRHEKFGNGLYVGEDLVIEALQSTGRTAV